MKIIICEGKNDRFWLSEILYETESNDAVLLKSTPLKQLQRIITRQYEYISKQYSVVLYDDYGKQGITNKLIPRITRDAFGKIPVTLKFLIVLDKDGEPLDKTINRIRSNIEEKRLSKSSIVQNTENQLQIKSESDERFKVEVNLLLIPDSLEIKITRKAKELSKINRYEENDPHTQLFELAGKLYLNGEKQPKKVERLVRKTIIESWFEDDEWFSQFSNKFKNFILPSG